MTTPATSWVVETIFAYHPADDMPDLVLPTELVKKYQSAEIAHRPFIDPSLEWDISTNGVLHPLKLYTNGQFALIGDGNHRVRIALKLGIEELPVQIIPDNFRRMRSRVGFPLLEAEAKTWVDKNLWPHTEHDVTKHAIGGGSGAGILANAFVKCVCDCGSYWKSEG